MILLSISVSLAMIFMLLKAELFQVDVKEKLSFSVSLDSPNLSPQRDSFCSVANLVHRSVIFLKKWEYYSLEIISVCFQKHFSVSCSFDHPVLLETVFCVSHRLRCLMPCISPSYNLWFAFIGIIQDAGIIEKNRAKRTLYLYKYT